MAMRRGGNERQTLADFRVDHGAVLECLLVDSFNRIGASRWRAWIVSPRTGYGCAPRRGQRRSGGIRPCRSAQHLAKITNPAPTAPAKVVKLARRRR